MAYQAVDIWCPDMGQMYTGFSVGAVIDATGEKIAMIGPVRWNPQFTGTKNITKVGFCFGTITKAGGSALTVSLQNWDAAATPLAPDGTQDQTVAIANANAAFASNTWLQTAALSATRTVTQGEMLAVVVEYDGAGRLGADSVIIRQMTAAVPSPINSVAMLFTASWARVNSWPNVVLEFDDGTFGSIAGGNPCSVITSLTVASNSAADEIALRFTVPFTCKMDMAWAYIRTSLVTSNFDFVLYDGTTVVTTASYDANASSLLSGQQTALVPFTETVLSPGITYYLSVKPTGTGSDVVILNHFDVAAANHFEAHQGLGDPREWHYGSRVDAGAWTPLTTRRPSFGIHICAIDTGSVSYPASRMQLGM